MPWLLTLAYAFASSGCYLHHERADERDGSMHDAQLHPRDGNVDDSEVDDATIDVRDGGPQPDGSSVDAAPDGDVDAATVRCVVPDEYLTLQSALDDDRCDVILIHAQVQQVGTARVARDVAIEPFEDVVGAARDGLVGDGAHSVLSIARDVTVVIGRIRIANGGGERGAGIDSEGELTLNGTHVSENQARGDNPQGGGIAQRAGSLRLVTATINGNSAVTETGSAAGAGLWLQDTSVQIDGAEIFGNAAESLAAAHGGALFARDSNVYATDAHLTNNYAVASNGTANGGAIHLERGELSLTSSRIDGNTAHSQRGGATVTGGGIFCHEANVAISDSHAANNRALVSQADAHAYAIAQGGFMAALACGLSLERSSIVNNEVLVDHATEGGSSTAGGALHCRSSVAWSIHASRFVGNRARGPGSVDGGAILSRDCDMLIHSSLIAENLAECDRGSSVTRACDASGGGLSMWADSAGSSSRSENTSWAGNVVRARSDGYARAYGGAVAVVSHVRETEVRFVSSTISSNRVEAAAHGSTVPAVGAHAIGGAVAVAIDPNPIHVTFHNATVAGNQVAGPDVQNEEFNISGGAIGTLVPLNAMTDLAISNSIFAFNERQGAPDNCSHPVHSVGFNLMSPMAFIAPHASDRDLDPGFGAIEACDDDAACYTIPISGSSPAVNAGDPNGCTDHNGTLITTDQRGMPRNGRCDVGAYELQ